MATDTADRSPKRRSSIAVPNQNPQSIVPRGRRRAHSIVPGAKLSPLAKARRALAPRKSILKASVNLLNVNQLSQPSSQGTSNDDANATGSMEMTQDFTELVRDNQSRKSFGRRVSFAEHSSVRLFPRARASDASTVSAGPSPEQPPPRQQSNENDYPGQNNRRRSSVRYSMAGSDDMDMTTVMDAPFRMPGSAILDEEFDYEDDEEFEDGDDMDVTQAVHGQLARKRSLSMAARRQSQLPDDADEGDLTRSDIGNDSMQSVQSEGNSELSQPMEFTVPLGQSLRPAQKDDVWLALKQMTHSGGEPSEPETSFEEETSRLDDDGGMHLDDAVARLKRARDSLPLSMGQVAQQDELQDDSFTSDEDSLDMDDGLDGNKTLNLSTMMGRPSMGRMSMGYESNMDESEVYGNLVASRMSLAPNFQPLRDPAPSSQAPSSTATAQKPRPSLVFQPPPANASTPAASGQPRKSLGTFSFTPNPPSPSKAPPPSTSTPSKQQKPKPTFSAAFAPPVSKPSPKKPTAAPALTDADILPAKRPRASTAEDINHAYIDQPSPAKRQALASAENTNDKAGPPRVSPAPNKNKVVGVNANANASPAKKLGFQPRASAAAQAQAEATARTSSLRRPSGYFAKRKSLAVSFSVPQPAPQPQAPKKTLGTGKGRASMASASMDAWKRFDRNAPAPGPVSVAPAAEVEGDVDVEDREDGAVHAHRASVSPEPSQGMNVDRDEPIVIPEIRRHSPELGVPQEVPRYDDEPELGELSGDMEVDNAATQQWRQGVEQEYEEEEEVPSISVAQFFSITGIKFMEELTAPRRSIHPSQAPIRHARNPADIPLSEYVVAMAIDIPQLDLYSRVSQDLEAWMAKSKLVFAEAEEEAAKVTPELFVEYARADEDGQAELLHQLNLIRTHTRYLARSDWYDWKLQWVEGLRLTAEEAFISLEKDARALEGPKKNALELIPELEREYEELMRELEQEQAEVAEIEGSDQDYLNELKATIAEQNIEIEALKAELKEGDDQVRWLAERMNEIEVQKRDAKNTITTAERVLRLKQTSTRTEVFRLKAELEALEDLNMFRITRVSPEIFEYIHNSLFHVAIPCHNFIPQVARVKITRHGKRSARQKDDFPRLSDFLLAAAKHVLADDDGADTTVRAIVHRLSAYWASCALLRTQLTILSVKYPVEIILPPTAKDAISQLAFKAQATVMFPKAMGKARISFGFSFDTFSQWPITINTLDCDVEVAYGPIDRDTILKAVVERTSQASAFENFACLLDACILAQDIYH